MGRRKRSRDDDKDYEYIMKKIKRLESKAKKRRLITSSTSDSDEFSRNSLKPENHLKPSDDQYNDDNVEIMFEEIPTVPGSPIPTPPPPCVASQVVAQHNETQAADEGQPDNNNIETLNQEILDLLGEDPTVEKSYGEDLHKDIALRWKNILLNGLSKEIRTELLNIYLPSENCSNMKAPKLNLEIKAALAESNLKKDMYSQSKQNQVTSCLAAIGSALNIVLTKSSTLPSEIIKPLSDAGRLLCDYHHKESLSRRYTAMSTLSKQTKDILRNTKIDDFLFGSDLTEQLKSSKAISKSGMEMRPTVAGPSGLNRKPTGTVSQQPAAPAVQRGPTLNVRGAPRAPAAEPRANPAPRRPPAPRHAQRTSARAPPPPPRYYSRKR